MKEASGMKPHKLDWAELLFFVIFVQGTSFARAQAPVQAWVQRYATPTQNLNAGRAIGVDTNGNVFISGPSWNGTNYGFLTLAYSSTGTLLWTNRYDAGAVSAQPSALAVGRDGNVFVTGTATVAYSNNGVALWTNTQLSGMAIAVGQSGTIFVLRNGSGDTMETRACSSAGVLLWTNSYQGTSPFSTRPVGLAVDAKENVFVAGWASSDRYLNYTHYAVVGYSGAGAPIWTNQDINPANASSEPSAVAVDGSGNVFVTGSWWYTPSGNGGYLTFAYSDAGVPLWTNRYSSTHPSGAHAMAVDANGNVFVTGTSQADLGAPGLLDFATIAYSASGAALWTNHYFNYYFNDDPPTPTIAADNHGHVVVTGFGGELDYVTTWYNSTNGMAISTNRYNRGDDHARALAVDPAGNVFVMGSSWNFTSYEFVIIKYAFPQPVPLWIQRLGDQVVLSWTNAAFSLQAAPTLSDVFTNVFGATSPYTNQIGGGSQFFRLISM
jgi:hypothetical protein